MSNTFGKLFRVTTFGESHGCAVGAVVDGLPAGHKIDISKIQEQLDRRKPGQSVVTTVRREEDKVEILSGVFNGTSLGSPIAMLVYNSDKKSKDYSFLEGIPRPSHADFTYKMKYGVLASGGGRASARETVARVAAGALAEQFLFERFRIEVVGWVSSVGSIECANVNYEKITRKDVDANSVRCPDKDSALAMEKEILLAKEEGDSVGGIVTCVCRNVPVGWGEPVFDKLTALLAYAMLSIPAARGIEFGAGFTSSKMRGSEHNDRFVFRDGRLRTVTNNSGGIQGGISNGEDIIFRVAFKPVASIAKKQITVSYDGKEQELEVKGRHDPCVVPRAIPVVEAMAAIVLADVALLAESFG